MALETRETNKATESDVSQAKMTETTSSNLIGLVNATFGCTFEYAWKQNHVQQQAHSRKN